MSYGKQRVFFLFINSGHNKVNKRLRFEETSTDPSWPKVPFPTKDQCNVCVLETNDDGDATVFDEKETYKYLKEFYTLQSKVITNGGTTIRMYISVLLIIVVLLFK